MDILEVLMSAQFNFETVAKQNPGLNQHPIYVTAKSQLDNAVAELTKQQDGE